MPRHLRQLFLLADVLLFQVIDRLTIPSTQLVHYTHSQNKHTQKNYSLVVLSETASQYLELSASYRLQRRRKYKRDGAMESTLYKNLTKPEAMSKY